ncbi:AbiV family abortive infection protein [Candidatus Magnetominusculus xianensis]|uniref:HEPN domain-containing protein n=1 Tax=Candidatus Magnetominusculus xianensis TaxID=1748249 RepID=A0ABR5SIT3_9BACT|nr:AbiV family abortive infection protein [Candidatus Magnetominusculus xianensis]KWT91773.1 hypothetical protein ASN18_0763 [Candidatus Magnetominusculus xianensis]MBF0404851.1 AbiV family abortive infection protein [Nitrospirota bacterium]
MPGGIIKTLLMNHLSERDKTSKKCYLEMYVKSLNEAKKLLNESEILLTNGAYQRSYFIAFAALEEISKSQLAADVYTGFIQEKEFKDVYKNHKKKIDRVKWIQRDGNSYPYSRWDNIRIDDFDFNKKLQSLYVDVDFNREFVLSPSDSISKDDSEKLIKAVKVGLSQIHFITEVLGEQIGTKGFMK